MRAIAITIFTSLVLLTAMACHSQESLAGNLLVFSTHNDTVIEDSTVLFKIKNISITGNRRTRNTIILRELTFIEGESYPLNIIVEKFYDAREQLMNTGLFRNVIVSLKSLQGHDAYVAIDVEEKWYFYPLPFIRVVDNKFSKWWNEKNRSLDQINYGIRLTQYNATGRNDKLFVYLMNGYSRQVAMEYRGFNLDPDFKWLAGLYFAYGKNHEVNYVTSSNKQVPFKNGKEYLHHFSRVGADIIYRPAIRTRHTFSFNYAYDKVADTIHKLNEFYSTPFSTKGIPSVGYTASYLNVDFIPYPTKGFANETSLRKVGFTAQENMWQLLTKNSVFWPVWKKSFFNLRVTGMLKLPFKQPYVRQQFLGSGNMYLQGYEDYIIDGVAGGFTKISFGHPLINSFIRLPGTGMGKKLNVPTTIPIKIYAKVFSNAGYVHNSNPVPYNQLNNKMLYSAGLGLDVVIFTDLVFKIDWSFNHLGQKGLYLHQREIF